MRFLELKKNLKKDSSAFKTIRLALLGDSATQHLTQAIRGYGYEIGVSIEVYEADYNQIDIQISCQDSELYRFKPEYVVLFGSVQGLKIKFYESDTSQRDIFADNEITRLNALVDMLVANMPAVKVIATNFMELNDSIFGQYANKTRSSFLYQIRHLNFELMELAINTANLFVCDIAALASSFGHTAAVDNRNYIDAGMTFGINFLPNFAKGVVDIVAAGSGAAKKCLILDLDNTLWGGTIGDDGIENIQLGDLLQGKAFTELQYWVRELSRRGILLAICSKNDLEVAKSPFRKHPDMVLSLDDVAIFVANWDSKVDNIKRIKDFLKIGYDAMVFIDDNPFERGVVRRHLPDVFVPELPEDPADYLPFLLNLNLFETISYTEDDVKRTPYFQQELKREVAQSSFTDERDFLASLGMVCEVQPFSKFNIPRAVQLLQRSNQFNLRTKRYSESELKSFCSSDSHFTCTFSVNDQFGNYGMISLVIGLLEHEELFIDTWIMSCRVLRRGVENVVLNSIVDAAKLRGIRHVRGEYIRTNKNELVLDHYRNLGFNDSGDGSWTLDVSVYQPREHFFEVRSILDQFNPNTT